MPKFACIATFSLATEIEPEFYRGSFDNDEVFDFEDNSGFGSESVTSYGGELNFTVEAADEHEVRNWVEINMISEGHEAEDSNGFTWLVEDLSLDIEEIEEEMNLAKACEIVQERINGWPDSDPLKGAMYFLLDYIQRTPFSG